MASVIDAHARRIVGGRISRRAHAAFVLVAREQVRHDRAPPRGAGPVHRSARGVRYVAIRYTGHRAQAGPEPSVGSLGDADGNALAASVLDVFKTALIRRRGPWRSLEDVAFATLERVAWFHRRRLLGPIGNLPPAEAEARYQAQPQQIALAA